MPSVEEHLTEEENQVIGNELLKTIVVPRNLNLLKGKLPKA